MSEQRRQWPTAFLQGPCTCGELALASGDGLRFARRFECCSPQYGGQDRSVEADAWLGPLPEKPTVSALLGLTNASRGDDAAALYRHQDSASRLLYVGVTDDLPRRQRWHYVHSTWAAYVASVQVEWIESREVAEASEVEAIKGEHPLFNLIHATPLAEKMRRLYIARLRFAQGPRRRGLDSFDRRQI